MPIPAAILNRDDVFHTIPHLTMQQAMLRLQQIENRNVNALANLLGDAPMLQYYTNNNGREAFKTEWGVAKEAANINPDCILVAGHAGGVTWGPFLAAGLSPLAHSHPYHDNSPASTRQIGGNGRVLWTAVNGEDAVQNTLERLKIFPSAGDFSFCAGQGISMHEVKTPYIVIHPIGNPAQLWIANPVIPAAPRLNFIIYSCVERNPGHYRANLQALQGGTPFWMKNDVDAFGGGGGGLVL